MVYLVHQQDNLDIPRDKERATPMYAIKFNRADRDFAVYFDGEIIGYAASAEEAEQVKFEDMERRAR